MKLNEKGFAVSTILYGILLVGVMVVALLMSTAAFNRKTTVDFVDVVEEELNQTAEAYIPSPYTHDISEQYEEWSAPKTGYYRITLSANGGDKVVGIIYLVVRQKLYFYMPSNSNVDVRLKTNNINSIIMSASKTSGSSYISGYPSMKSPTSETNSTKRDGQEQTLHYSGRYFINAQILSSTGTSAKIEFLNSIVDISMFRDPNLSNIRFVRDCIVGDGVKSWSEIYVMSDGLNIASGRPVAAEGAVYKEEELTFLTNSDINDFKTLDKANCLTVDVGKNINKNTNYNIDAIGVYHDVNTQHDISVSEDGVNFYPAPASIAIGNGQGFISNGFPSLLN